MLKTFLTSTLITILSSPSLAADRVTEPLDYSLLSHTIAVESLRAGNHDPSGANSYRFKATMYGRLNTAEERNLPPEKRKNLPVELGTFGDTKIDALSAWRADDKTKDVKEIRVEGNAVRELVAKVMTEFKASENEVEVEVDVEMLLRGKKFYVWGFDTPLAKTSYFIIAPTKFETPSRSNLALTITDDKGTLVKIDVRYDKQATPPKGAAAAAGKSGDKDR